MKKIISHPASNPALVNLRSEGLSGPAKAINALNADADDARFWFSALASEAASMSDADFFSELAKLGIAASRQVT